MEFTEQEVLEFMKDHKPEVRQPGDMVASEMGEFWGCHRATARTKLDKLVEQGYFTKIEDVAYNDTSGNVYRPTDKIKE